VKNYAVLFIAAGLFATTAWSQTPGEVTGRISDPSSAGIPGAAITLTNVSTNAARTTTTTDSGDYTMPSVPPESITSK